MLTIALLFCCTNDAPNPEPPAPEPTDPVDSGETTPTITTTTPPTGDTGAAGGTGDTGATTPTDPSDTVGALTFLDGQRPSRLLVISLDTTRRDYIGRFSGNGLTPALDAVLAEAVVLEDHRSCSNWTAPSMTCVMSGRTPMHFNFFTWNYDDAVPNRPPPGYADVNLPGKLSAAGFATSLVTANWVFSSGTGVANGFRSEIIMDYAFAPDVAAEALRAYADVESTGNPWYLHVHFMDPHGPYCAPEAFVDTSIIEASSLTLEEWCGDSYGPGGAYGYLQPDEQRAMLDAYHAMYAGEMAYWDTEFGAFWQNLDQAGALDDTLVMFVTDHGQQFFERGGHGHGIRLGNEENRSTAAFWAKNLAPVAYTEPTYHPDLTATLFEVFGLQAPQPLVGITVGSAPADRSIRTLNYWGWQPELMVVHDDHQLIYHWLDSERWFYDLTSDPEGLIDVYDPTDPALVAAWTEMNAWIDEVHTVWDHLPDPVAPGP